jgi:hypothetical protein
MNEGLKQKILDKAKSHIQLCVNEVLTGEEFVNKKDVLGLLDEVTKQIQERLEEIKQSQTKESYILEFQGQKIEFNKSERFGMIMILQWLLAVLDGEHKK